MRVNRKTVTLVAGAAWVSAAVFSIVDGPPRLFFLVVIFAASVTVPLMTATLVANTLPPAVVSAARKHVHAYLAGWCDAGGPGPDGDREDVDEVEEPPRLRAV